MNHDEQLQLNLKHRKKPQAGDYWHEMFCPVLLVLDVGPRCVVFLEKKKDVDGRRWTWDTKDISALSPKQFAKRITYSTMDKTWCDVVPDHAEWETFAKDAFAMRAAKERTI